MNKTKKLIEKILDGASTSHRYDGKIWYTRLNRFCRDLGTKYNQPTWKVTAIMSILSPITSFRNNIHDTEQLLKYGENTYLKSPLFREKAIKALNAESYQEVRALFNERTGRKTLSFWENLNLVGNRTTLDVWMIRGLGIEGSLTQKKYREAEKCIQDYATNINMKAYELQAVLWTTLRGVSF